MGGKHGKYAYVDMGNGWYVKVRVLKSRDEKDPDRYIPVGFRTRNPPYTFPILKLEELPEEARRRIMEA